MVPTALCPRCGASTPAPADLAIATFACASCGELLSTASAVGAAVTEAHGFVRGVEAALAGQAAGPLRAPAPTPLPPRASACLRCKAPVAVPMDLRVRELTCAGCGSTQPVAAHVSDVDRMVADQQRQLAENARLRTLRAEGTTCPQCAGHVPIAADGVQATCPFCGATVALAGLVGAETVAREQLGRGVRGAIDAARASQERRRRWVDLAILGGIGAAFALVLGGLALSSAVGALAAWLR